MSVAPLNVDLLLALLGADAPLFDLRALPEATSTNTVLMAAGQTARNGTVVVADRQTAGRGRRGRVWQSAPAASLTFSLLWHFTAPAASLSALPLTVGLALAEGLEALGVRQVGLKWPNDLLLRREDRWAKVGGILVELSLQGSRAAAVIGVGLNLQPLAVDGAVDFPVTSLAEALPATAPGREAVLGVLLPALQRRLQAFADTGFASARDAWTARHVFHGADVQVLQAGQPLAAGRCLGVTEDGALRLATVHGEFVALSGDVSLRPQ